MTQPTPITVLVYLRQAACLVVCALFLFPTTTVQTASTSVGGSQPVERDQPNKHNKYIDDSSDEDAEDRIVRRCIDYPASIAHSVESNEAYDTYFGSQFPLIDLKDVYHNGLGSRLRC